MVCLHVGGRAPLFLYHCLDGIWNVDALSAVAFGDGFDELMGDESLIVEYAGLQDDDKVDGGVSKVREADDRICRSVFIYAGKYLFCPFDGDALDFFKIAVVGDANGDGDIDLLRGQTVVGDV